jgi:hypothetical protein
MINWDAVHERVGALRKEFPGVPIIVWTAGDVQTLRFVEDDLIDRSVELGWDVLDVLLGRHA